MLWAALLISVLPDLIHLKDGRVWTGEIVEQEPDRVRVKLPKGAVWVARTEIESIETVKELREQYAKRSKAAATADERRALAKWCLGCGLGEEARAEWEAIVKAAPDDEDAHRALGHVKHDGKWMTPEEAAKAKGLVERDGEWVTPARVKILDLLADVESEDLVARAKAKRAIADLEDEGAAELNAIAESAKALLAEALSKEGAVLSALQERAKAARGPLVSLVANEERFPSKNPPDAEMRRMRAAVGELELLGSDPAGAYLEGDVKLAAVAARLRRADLALGVESRLDALKKEWRAKAGGEAAFRGIDPFKALRAKADEANVDVKMSEEERALLDEISRYRLRCGRSPLVWSERLADCARQHTDEMDAKKYFSHVSPVTRYSTLTKRCELAGFHSQWIGENLALGDDPAKEILKAFQDSPGHHRNLLFGDYTRVGIAKKGEYWTVNFGGDPK